MRLTYTRYSKILSWQLLLLSCFYIQVSGMGPLDRPEASLRSRRLQAGPAAGANITWTSCTSGTVLNSNAAGNASYTFGASDCDGNAFTAICEATGTTAASLARVIISSISGNNILRFDRSGTLATVTKARLKSTAGDLFQLTNLTVFPVNTGNQTLTVTAYKAGVAISGSAITINYVSSVPIHGTTLTSADFGTFYNSIDEVQVTTNLAFGVSMDNIQTAVALPVTFSYFNGRADGQNVLLNWGTALESNVKNFTIEQSVDGSIFAPRGTVDSKAIGGNSASPLNYSHTDVLSVTSPLALLYRIKESDLDGRFIYSPVLKIDAATSSAALSIYPNPFRQQVIISVTSPEQDKAVILVTDMAGRRLIEQVSTLQKGSNILSLPAMSLLGKGAYLFSISTSRQRQTVQLEKIE